MTKALSVLAAIVVGAISGEIVAWAIGIFSCMAGSPALFNVFVVGVFAGPILGAVIGVWYVLRSPTSA